jgi:hypothetical protein
LAVVKSNLALAEMNLTGLELLKHRQYGHDG